jgi:hypothetical protein
MQSLLKQPGYRLHPPDNPEARALLAEQGLGPAVSTGLSPTWNASRARRSARSSGSTRTACSAPPRGLATGPARRLPRALHPPALAQGPGTARPGARGQHGAVPPGRRCRARPRVASPCTGSQAEGLVPNTAAPLLIYAAAASRPAAPDFAKLPNMHQTDVTRIRCIEIALCHLTWRAPEPFEVGFRARPVQPALSQSTHPIDYDWE